ncbi:trithorax group protein osa-like, partial [Balaenoptera acutorostrata]|uniref:Trithorax group protein osa-like n=1 Tax=Balaenoptera acutorostrata TaxID=9767 RepID=A0ABM3SUD6_BALAC
MHGLIFETSICYWQDQPGRGKREHTEPGVAGARGAGRGRRGGGRPPQRGREGRRTPGPDRQPTLGTTRGRGAPPRRRSVEGRGWGGFPFPAPLPPTHTTSAAHNLGAARERGRGPREVARRPGRHVPARSRSLARADGGGGARAEARTPPFPARPPGAGRGGHGGRSTTAGREPDDPRSGERARAGRSTAGGQTAVPPRPTHNDVARRAAVAADHGAEPRQARGATHTGTRPGDRQTRRTRRVDGRERGPTGRGWLGRHRADAATTSQKPWREGAAARHREGARGAGPKGPGASRPPGHNTGSHRQRPPAQGRSRSTQDADWPPQPPQGRAPLAGLATTTAKHPRAAAGPQEHSPARTPAAPRTPPHTHLRRARLPRLRNREHSTRGRRRPRRPVGRHPHEGEAGSAPDGEGDVGGDPPSSKSDRRGSRPRETLPSEATRTAPTHRRRLRLAATVADDPARRTPDTWHGACGVGSSQPPPGACGGGVGVTRGRRPTRHLAPPPSGTGPSESPGEDLVRDKEISHSAASDERAPRGTAPGPRPPYPGHPVRLGPVPSPRPELAVEEGAGQGEKKSRPPTGTHVGTLKGRVASDGRVGPRGRRGAGGCWSTRPGGPSSRLESAATVTPSQTCTPNLKRQQEAPTPGRHRDSRHQRRLAPGTLPRARRPSHSPHEGRRRSSRDKGQYKSGRQVAPDNRLRRPRAGSRSPAGHRGRCSAAGPPKRPSSARGEAAGVWRGPEASVSELAPGSARHGATPAADG